MGLLKYVLIIHSICNKRLLFVIAVINSNLPAKCKNKQSICIIYNLPPAMRIIPNKRFFLLFHVQLFVLAIYVNAAKAQSPIQQFDDRVMIDIQNTRTPEKTGFMLFMSNSMKYGNIGIPAAMLTAGIIGKNEALRQNS